MRCFYSHNRVCHLFELNTTEKTLVFLPLTYAPVCQVCRLQGLIQELKSLAKGEK